LEPLPLRRARTFPRPGSSSKIWEGKCPRGSSTFLMYSGRLGFIAGRVAGVDSNEIGVMLQNLGFQLFQSTGYLSAAKSGHANAAANSAKRGGWHDIRQA